MIGRLPRNPSGRATDGSSMGLRDGAATGPYHLRIVLLEVPRLGLKWRRGRCDLASCKPTTISMF